MVISEKDRGERQALVIRDRAKLMSELLNSGVREFLIRAIRVNNTFLQMVGNPDLWDLDLVDQLDIDDLSISISMGRSSLHRAEINEPFYHQHVELRFKARERQDGPRIVRITGRDVTYEGTMPNFKDDSEESPIQRMQFVRGLSIAMANPRVYSDFNGE